ncbi:MAG: type 1 glutamine amidotransferase family protein [Bacteroidota bacterium]
MKKRNCFVYVFDGFSDWEPSLVMAALQKFTDFEVTTFSKDGKRIRSLGNVAVMPDRALNEVNVNEIDLLILPGGHSWEQGGNLEIKSLLNEVLDANKTVAAICGATAFLGEQGYLNSVKHTSNHLEYYLKQYAPSYRGEQNYVKQLAVADGNLITASGVAMVEFASEILNQFNLLEEEPVATFMSYFKHPEMALS